MRMDRYTVRVHVPAQDLDVEVIALNKDSTRELVRHQLDGIDYAVQWVQLTANVVES